MQQHQIAFHEEVKKEKRKKRLTLFFVSFLILFIGVGISWIFFYSPVCKFYTIHITGQHELSSKRMQQAFSSLRGQNMFFYSFNTVQIETKYPIIESITISPAFFGVANVSITEAKPVLAVQTTSKTYIIGSNGSVVHTISNTNTPGSLPLIVSNQSNMKKIDLLTLIQFVQALEVDKTEFIVSFTYTYPYDLQVLYADGHTALVSMNKPVATQISAIQGVGKYVGFSKCKHVDVRFDSVYCSG